jgi:uncharacterized protein YqkB
MMKLVYGKIKRYQRRDSMHITYTDEAVEQINRKFTAGSGELKLVFDTEGCGCSVNGIPTLWMVDKAHNNDWHASGTPYELLYHKKDEIFFEEKMTLDYSAVSRSYVLKSSGQIYNANLQLIDKREN